jgi:Amt family ammonium transporter
MGILDFAGGTVVHINAGIAGLVCALVLGKRVGYGTDNMAPYNLSLAVIGASLLWVGWFGFNAGSAVGANGRAGMAMAVTQIATAAAALGWMFAEWITKGIGGIVGALLTGVFSYGPLSATDASPDGSPGGLAQLKLQAIGVCSTLVYSGVMTFVLLMVTKVLVGLKVNEEEEREGLDIVLHGEQIF